VSRAIELTLLITGNCSLPWYFIHGAQCSFTHLQFNTQTTVSPLAFPQTQFMKLSHFSLSVEGKTSYIVRDVKYFLPCTCWRFPVPPA